ncbi:MAG: DUF4912 domain-containing protein [Nitrospirae bacterium]|nr:DUF4912 domain-containing protein [Nitrospirota bacterium]
MTPIRRKSDSKPSRPKSGRRAGGRRAELLAKAKSFGIKGRHRMTLPQLIRAVEPNRKKRPIVTAAPIQTRPVPTAATPAPIPPKQKYDDLPWSYGETELVLMPVDPFLIHAYWDFSPEDWETIQRHRRPVVLRVYDVTMIEFDGANAHHYFDLPVTLETQNWYVRLWSAEKSLCADLGWWLPDGSFQTLVRSNVIQTPRAGVSIFDEVRWVGTQRARRARGGGSIRLGPARTRRFAADVWRGRREPLQKEQLAFWKRLEEEAAGLTAGGIAGLSSLRIRTMTPPETEA